MKICKAAEIKPGICEVTGEDGRRFWVKTETAMLYCLRPGMELSEEQLREILDETDRARCRESALRILSGRACSRMQLERKLAEKYSPELAAATAEQMEQAGLVDDGQYAYMLAADMMRLRQLGDGRVLRELRMKGVSRETAEEAIERVHEEFADDLPEDVQRIYAVLQRKYPGYEGDGKIRRRAVNGLMRLGYAYSDIKAALSLEEDALEDALYE